VRGTEHVPSNIDVNVSIANKPFSGNVPLYEELGQGYAIRFGKRQDGSGTANLGTGELTVELFVDYNNNYPVTLYLEDFNMNLVDQKDEPNAPKASPQSPTYSYGDEAKPAYKNLTNYLMSEYEEVTSFSQVYTDNAGNTKLGDISYSLPIFNPAGTTQYFTKSERPEQHQLRVIKELLSSQLTLSDIIEVNNDLLQVKYNNQLLVRDAYTLDCLNNSMSVDWNIKRMNYTN
jgi:hypothetical protein